MVRAIRNILALIAVLFVVNFSVPVFAQEHTDVKVHFSDDVAIPGNLLDPGDYIIRTLDPVTYPKSVEVLTGDGTRSLGFFIVSPVERVDKSQTVVDLSAPDDKGVRMIQDWYLAGDPTGYQLSYSKKDIRKADQLAEARGLATGSSGQSAAGQP